MTCTSLEARAPERKGRIIARHITEVVAKGKTHYISQSDLDIEGEADQLYYDSTRGGGFYKLKTSWVLRRGEIVEWNTGERVSKYDIAEWISPQ